MRLSTAFQFSLCLAISRHTCHTCFKWVISSRIYVILFTCEMSTNFYQMWNGFLELGLLPYSLNCEFFFLFISILIPNLCSSRYQDHFNLYLINSTFFIDWSPGKSWCKLSSHPLFINIVPPHKEYTKL